MRSTLFHAMVAVLLCSPLAASGQTPVVAGQSSTPERITIVGCLVQGNPVSRAAENRAQTAIPNANDFFVRTPTIALAPGSTVTVGKPGTTDTATSAGTPTRDSFYRITGLDREQLRTHVGHRVELQGTLTDNMPGSATTESRTRVDPSGRATTTTETRVDVAGVLHATSIKMVSERCP